jgi:NAD(P)-dependent dehydrogenase (short-subunit alcohol dehydrogenase family)
LAALIACVLCGKSTCFASFMDLTDKAALITGGKRIGLAIAEALARRGVDVALSYARSRTEAEEGSRRIHAAGAKAAVFQADLSSPDACRLLVSTAAEALGRLDILINMASVYVRKPLAQLHVDDWNGPITVDLRASFLCAQAAIPFMRAQGGGRIVNFADWVAASRRPRYPGFLPYYVAKAGVIALTEALALELAADKILVNAIAPGPILAPPDTTDEEFKAVEEATPLGRWGGEEEIAKAVVALIESDFITGETVRVDGGRHLR